jgi:hypothetical protein
MAENLRRFGCVLRAARLGWTYYAPYGFYVRISPIHGRNPEIAKVEVAKSFGALSSGSTLGQHYRIGGKSNEELRELLSQCEAIDAAAKLPDDYFTCAVDEQGRIVRG